MIDNSILKEVGTALYGKQWQTDLAKSLKVSDRRLRRWHANEFEIPPGVIKDLLTVAQDRRAECSAAVALVRKHIEDNK
ncbi:hypothetical protein [Lichenifustis flavocetrariae]|uniref:Uncharacterized protein n=1 Tax=Lichenifustis flavocetrariae TaxID=2949735 RepID=A0AA41YR85_9HYPH|nr:hypothetical protein [Lichenifustis flavocetrariae]MCW6507071.1 hypothetical protein [Lichenifustis flavocetrariae]